MKDESNSCKSSGLEIVQKERTEVCGECTIPSVNHSSKVCHADSRLFRFE